MASKPRKKRAATVLATRRTKRPNRTGTPARSTTSSRLTGREDADARSSDDERHDDHDDPLAMTPLRTQSRIPSSGRASSRRIPSSTARTTITGSSTARRRPPPRARGTAGELASEAAAAAGLDRGQVVSVRGTEEDLVPPSDEDEFEEWVDQRATEKQARQARSVGGRAVSVASDAAASARMHMSDAASPAMDSPLAAVGRKRLAYLASRSPTPETMPLFPVRFPAPDHDDDVSGSPLQSHSTRSRSPVSRDEEYLLNIGSSATRPKFFTFFSDGPDSADIPSSSPEWEPDDEKMDVDDGSIADGGELAADFEAGEAASQPVTAGLEARDGRLERPDEADIDEMQRHAVESAHEPAGGMVVEISPTSAVAHEPPATLASSHERPTPLPITPVKRAPDANGSPASARSSRTPHAVDGYPNSAYLDEHPESYRSPSVHRPFLSQRSMNSPVVTPSRRSGKIAQQAWALNSPDIVESQYRNDRIHTMPAVQTVHPSIFLHSPSTPAKPSQASRPPSTGGSAQSTPSKRPPIAPVDGSRLRSESPDVLDMGFAAAFGEESALTPPPPETVVPARARQEEESHLDNRLETLAPRRPALDAETLAVVDPELYQFRSARTFRTRTALQLQPYTRERQLYEAVLRKGGLKKGKHVIAPARDITPGEEDKDEDEDYVSESESAEITGLPGGGTDIVIGGTPPPERQRRQRTPRPVEEEDLDEFFDQHERPADEGNEEDARLLQRIVRARLRKEKEARRVARENDKARKEFERLMRESGRARSGTPLGEEQQEKRTEPTGKKSRRDPKQSAAGSKGATRTVTYGRKEADSARRRSEPGGSDSDFPDRRARTSSVRPRHGGRASPPHLSASPSSVLSAGGRQAFSPFNAQDGDSSGGPPDHGGPGSPFFIDDLPDMIPPSPVQTGRIGARSETGSDSDSSTGKTPQDRRARIAARMLPAAMLRRLEREAAAKEAQKTQQRRRDAMREARGESPVRPGRAIVRRTGAGQGVAFDDVVDYASSSSQEAVARALSPAPLGSARATPIVISDGEAKFDGNSDSESSQAEEENRGAETLARLYDGDYESIVAGPRRPAFGKGSRKRKRTDRERRRKPWRPALGFIERPRGEAGGAGGNKYLVQSRLDFPAEDKHAKISTTGKNKKRSRDERDRPRTAGSRRASHKRHRPRPVIRVNEESIFAVQDFAFESDDDGGGTAGGGGGSGGSTPASPHVDLRTKKATTKRSFEHARQLPLQLSHTPDRPPAPVRDQLDEGVGKARSWANFERFPIDFGISPLPSGLYCSADSVVGDGSLRSLLRFIRSNGESGFEQPTDIHVYGFDLQRDMTCDAVRAVLPFITEAIGQSVLDMANETLSRGIAFEVFDFLAAYLATTTSEQGHGDLAYAVRDELASLSKQLDGIASLDSKRDRAAIDKILLVRWHILSLLLRLDRLPRLSTDEDSMVPESHSAAAAATALQRTLLSSGFDRAIKPLKQVIRGEADTAEIKEPATILWIATVHAVTAFDPSGHMLFRGLELALEATFPQDKQGPLAAERVWFLAFGLSALSQFGADGRTTEDYDPVPRWDLVRKAISLIKISHNEEAEERARADQLQGRDRYIKAMLARCVRLSSTWRWAFDRDSFSVATKDLGVIFKDRQHRNLPTEPPINYPAWITGYDISLTAAGDSRRETAFELYLRLVCVAASDIISGSQSLAEAKQAEKDVQRLIMSIIPVSPVRFDRLHPPTPKQLGQLINRYATIIAACYFSPSLLSWLLANAKKWAPFESADFESRQISIRGLMYLAVACRHHQAPLQPVMARLADILAVLQKELDAHGFSHTDTVPVSGGPRSGVRTPSKLEVQRTMVLVVSCIRQIILHHSFDVEQQSLPAYPDPCLLHTSWTERIFDLSTNDPRSGLEIIGTIQAFLDARAAALPRKAKQARDDRLESQDEEFGSLGFELDPVTIARLGGEAPEGADAIDRQDEQFANIVEKDISPRIYRILSDLLPAVVDDKAEVARTPETDVFVAKLTKCWSDCAAVVVVEHQRLDWSTFVGPFGKQSWARLGSELGRQQVGLHFMLNVLRLDPGSFSKLADEYISLLFQVIVTPRSTVEHEYVTALLTSSSAKSHPLFEGMGGVRILQRDYGVDAAAFLEGRGEILQRLFENIAQLLGARNDHPRCRKSLLYSCVQLLISSMIMHQQAIPDDKVILRESYRAFTSSVAHMLVQYAGQHLNPFTIPDLKHFPSTVVSTTTRSGRTPGKERSEIFP